MSGDARDFNNMDSRGVIKSPFPQGKAPKEIYAILRETLGAHSPLFATVKNWLAQFKRGDFFTCFECRKGGGLPREVTSESRDVNIHGGEVNDLWTGSDVICKQLWRTTLPQAVT